MANRSIVDIQQKENNIPDCNSHPVINVSSLAEKAIKAVYSGKVSYCKFLSANDTSTNSHQCGIYIAKNAVPILFGKPCQKGEKKERSVKILWQDEYKTDSRFVYYGEKTRNEYRITTFGKNFPFLTPDHAGDLFVLTQVDDDYYQAYILQTDNEVEEFLDEFGMSPADTGKIIEKEISREEKIEREISAFIQFLKVDFPSSDEMASKSREIYDKLYNHKENTVNDPDKILISWTQFEYTLFQKLEIARYSGMINRGFSSVDEFVKQANIILNRRKSRAGKSLEHHLSAIFNANKLPYESQPKTEDNKRPDFIFPGGEKYRDKLWPDDRLVFLGVKTTCKDRWRQILNEADRIKKKHLFTLQQSISLNQIDEMEKQGVVLVVPKAYHKMYPAEKRNNIFSLSKFISFVKEKVGTY